MGGLFGGGGDDSGIQQQIDLENQEYNDEVYETDQAKAKAENEMLTIQHASTGIVFGDVPEGVTVNPEKSSMPQTSNSSGGWSPFGPFGPGR
jgi:hypothetical protein